MASRSIKRIRLAGKVLGQNSADIFRKEEEEEEGKKLAGLHLVVIVWNAKKRYRYDIFSCYDQKWSRRSNRRFPFPTKNGYELLGSCNGLLCLEFFSDSSGFASDIGHKIVVCEPSTNKLQLIPHPDSMKPPCKYSSHPDSLKLPCKYSSSKHRWDVSISGGGLFFDSRSGDYKLFCFTKNYFQDKNECSMFLGPYKHVQVYSVKNNVWKELSYPLFNDHQIGVAGNGICVNGVCYWYAQCIGDYSLILSFNFVTEEFSTFHGPKHDEDHFYELVELDGSLGVLIYPIETDEDDWKGVISLMVYSSASASWSRVDFDEVPVVGFHEILWFGKRNDTYYLLLKGPQGLLLEYDYTRKMFNQIHKMPGPVDDCDAYAYETKTTKNNADIWNSSSFHLVEAQNRLAVYASHQTGDDY